MQFGGRLGQSNPRYKCTSEAKARSMHSRKLAKSLECKTNGEKAIHLNLYPPFAHRLLAVPNAVELGIVK